MSNFFFLQHLILANLVGVLMASRNHFNKTESMQRSLLMGLRSHVDHNVLIVTYLQCSDEAADFCLMAQLFWSCFLCFFHNFVTTDLFVRTLIASFTALSLGMEDQPDYCEVVAMMLTSRQWRS